MRGGLPAESGSTALGREGGSKAGASDTSQGETSQGDTADGSLPGSGAGDGGYEGAVLVLHGFHGPPSLEAIRKMKSGFVPPVADFVISEVRGRGGAEWSGDHRCFR